MTQAVVGTDRPAPKLNRKHHTKQSEVFRDSTRFRCVVAGRRWGKTDLSADELIVHAAKKRKQLVWYVAPTYGMAKDIMWDRLIDRIPREWVKKANETRLTIVLKNGSIIQLKGSDKPDTLRGRGVNFVVLDEFQDFREGVWDAIIFPTLIDTSGRALIIGTPKSFNNLYKLWSKGQDPKNVRLRTWKSWQFPTITSPFIPKSEIETARRTLDEKTFNQEFNASFESMNGLVYYPFERRFHVRDLSRADGSLINPKLPIWVGQDFNIDPMSAIICQPQPNGELWALDEIVLKSSNTTEICDELERRYWRWKSGITIFPDPAGATRSTARGESDLQVFRDRGFRKLDYPRKHPLVSNRINAVNSLLKAADGTVRVRVHETCANLIQAFEQVIYKPNSREVDKTQGIEHIADAFGYMVHRRFDPVRRLMFGVSI